MWIKYMEEIWFERHFEFNGKQDVILRIFEPKILGHGWRCDYILLWPGKADRRFSAPGVDKLQSLMNCLLAADSFLTSRRDWKDGNLLWLGLSDLGLTISLPE
jgi:hypothetical protein